MLDKILFLAASDTDTVSDVGEITTDGRTVVGGGGILDFFNQSNKEDWVTMDGDLINHLNNIGLYKIIIVLLILTIFVILLMKLLGIRSVTNDAGIRAEIDNVKTLRKTEKSILSKQKNLNRLKEFIAAVGLQPGQIYVDYMNYNLRRAGIMAPGGDRPLDAFEFNAMVKAGTAATMVVCILAMLFASLPLGFIALVVSLICWSIIPNMIVRKMATEKDDIIKNNFFEFYQEIHYILINGGNAPLAKRVRSYGKSVKNNPELVRFADTCADLFDIWGEREGAVQIAKEYREIPDVTKLMRLIQQFNDGAEIKNDLMGFRSTLLLQQQIRLEETQKKIVTRARLSFNVLMLVLFQAILSAMLIYLPDLTNIGDFL